MTWELTWSTPNRSCPSGLLSPLQLFPMKLISWNIRGLNNKGKKRLLRTKLQDHRPDIFMLQETKCSEATTTSLLQHCWRNLEVIALDAQGFSGGLSLARNRDTISLQDFSATRHTLTAFFHITGTNITGYVTTVYGPQTTPAKLSFINELHTIVERVKDHRWIVSSDFNMILSLQKKKGGL
jgi:exonuclease III